METDCSRARSGKDSSAWPASAILGYGTFGSGTPAARRYHIRSAIALVVMACCWFGTLLLKDRFPNPALQLIQALTPGVVFTYIAWEFRIYLLALDELARRMQLEAIAWTYLSGLAIAMLVGGLALVYGGHVNRLWLNPVWFILLEGLRAGWLYLVSRRY